MTNTLHTRILTSCLALTTFFSSCNYGTKNVTYTNPPPTPTDVVVAPAPDNSYPNNGTGYVAPPAAGNRPHLSLSYPVQNPFVSPDCHVQVGAHVDFVQYPTDIQITLNGTITTSWFFNPNDGTINADFRLAPGNNVVSIIANNSFGSDAVSEYIQFPQHLAYQVNTPGQENPPQIVLVSPTDPRLTTAVNNLLITATMNHVHSMDEIQVKQNGVSTSNFTFDPYSKSLQFPASLYPGVNYFYIMAANANGSDGVGVKVYYAPPVVVGGNTILPPGVFFANGMSNPFLSTSRTVSVTAQATNVSDRHQVEVYLDGQRIHDFSFDQNSGNIQFAINANPGNNHVYIRATNDAGSDGQSLNVIYSAPSIPLPVITVTNPTANPAQTTYPCIVVDAFVDHIYSADKIHIEVNGVEDSYFSYYPSVRKIAFSPMLNLGGNTIRISARNEAGATSRTLQIVYAQPAVLKPVVTITNPISNPFNSAIGSAFVMAQVLNVNSQNDIQVMVNGNVQGNFVYNANNSEIEFRAPLVVGSNIITISAGTGSGSDRKSVTIMYAPAPNKPTVSFIAPGASPFVTSAALLSLSASVLNVVSARDIEVKLNGVVRTDVAYNPGTHLVTLKTILTAGSNYFTVTATNISGVDSKALEVSYTAPQVTPKPTVSILEPSANPYTAAGNTATVTAQVMNVQAKSEVKVTVNGADDQNFGFDNGTHQVRFNTTLNPGNNYVSVSATNNAGSESKSFDVICTPPPVAKPVITVMNPAQSPFTSTLAGATIQVSVMNINNRNELEITANGTAVTNFNYNTTTHLAEISVILKNGKNEFTIQATNNSGTEKKDLVITYTATPPGNGSGPVAKPTVTIANPAGSTSTTSSASLTLNAFVEGVVSSADIHLTHDNTPVAGFNYNASSHALNFSTALHTGANTFVLSGTNDGGTVSKTVVVTYTAPASTVSMPVISITSPTLPGTTITDHNFPITATITNMTGSNGISVNINSASVPFTFDVATKVLSTSGHLQIGLNDIHITAANGGGTDSRTSSIKLGTPAGVPATPAPAIAFINPFRSPVTTSDQMMVITASIQNITSDREVTMTNNGRNLSITYNAAAKQITSTESLTAGANNITITATTKTGTDTKSASINYVPASGTGNLTKPAIQFINPAASPARVDVYTPDLSVMITGIAHATDVTLKVNGAVFATGVNYNPSTHLLTFKPNLVSGANSIEIKASNTAGAETKTLSIESTTKGGGKRP